MDMEKEYNALCQIMYLWLISILFSFHYTGLVRGWKLAESMENVYDLWITICESTMDEKTSIKENWNNDSTWKSKFVHITKYISLPFLYTKV